MDKKNVLNCVFLSLGTNLGDKKLNLSKCINLINDCIGKIVKKSSIYSNKALGFESESLFYNMVIKVETNLDPLDLLEKTQSIEKELGRVKNSINTYEDRIIDIDILFYDNFILNNEKLTIPHPLLYQRNFVLIPFCEIEADFLDPLSNKSMNEIQTNSNDSSELVKISL